MIQTEFSKAMYKKGWRICRGMSGYVYVTPDRQVLVWKGVHTHPSAAWKYLESVVSDGRLDEFMQPPTGNGMDGIDFSVSESGLKVCEDDDHSFEGWD